MKFQIGDMVRLTADYMTYMGENCSYAKVQLSPTAEYEVTGGTYHPQDMYTTHWVSITGPGCEYENCYSPYQLELVPTQQPGEVPITIGGRTVYIAESSLKTLRSMHGN